MTLSTCFDVSKVRKMLEKLAEDTKPREGEYPPEDDEDFERYEYFNGNQDDAMEWGDRWGRESRNRTIHPIVLDILQELDKM